MGRLIQHVRVQHLLIVLWLVTFSVDAMGLVTDSDTPWHIATGLQIMQHHAVPTTDPFSWSMHGMPWVTQEWLFEVVLAWLVAHFGFFGYWLLLVTIHAFTVIMMYQFCLFILPTSRVGAALAASLSTIVAWPFWIVRPQIVSYAFFAFMLLILERVHQGKFRILWIVPFLILVWSNSHSSVLIGIFMLLFDVVVSFVPTLGRLRKYQLPSGSRWRLLVTAIISVGAAFVNPNGIRELTYALLSSNKLMVSSILEWHSPDFHSPYYKYNVLIFFALSLLLLLASKRQISLRQTMYFGATFCLTLIYQRFVPYFALATAGLLTEIISYWLVSLDKPSKMMRWFASLMSVLSLGYLAIQIPATRGTVDTHMSKTAYPVDAVNYLAKHPIQGRLLNAYNFGGYLIYRHISTFVDGRTDIFLNNHIFEDYMQLQNLGWDAQTLLETYQFTYALLPSNYALSVYLNHRTDWRIVYQDGVAEILVHSHGS